MRGVLAFAIVFVAAASSVYSQYQQPQRPKISAPSRYLTYPLDPGVPVPKDTTLALNLENPAWKYYVKNSDIDWYNQQAKRLNRWYYATSGENPYLILQKPIQQPSYQNQQPVVQNQQPSYQNQQPVVQNQQPSYQNQQPVVQNQQPYQNQQPVIQNQQPSYQNQQPVIQNPQPVIQVPPPPPQAPAPPQAPDYQQPRQIDQASNDFEENTLDEGQSEDEQNDVSYEETTEEIVFFEDWKSSATDHWKIAQGFYLLLVTLIIWLQIS